MNHDLHHQVLQRLQADYGLKPAAGQWLRGGTCPACGKRELYTHAEHPWLVRCGRQSKCGSEYHVKDLYDDLFDDWSKRAPASEQQPTASARAYLEFSRGFRLELIEGWFTQENYFDREANAGSATVRFPMEGNGYWERLIDRPHRFGKKKARFMPGYSYRGKWWCPPCVDLLEVDELWLVEGIFDAIALLHHGIAAVSVMSSNGYPEEKLRELKAKREAAGGKLPTLVWALDNEPGARAYTRKHVRKARELGFTVEAAQIPQRAGKKTDWNDLHQRWAFEANEEDRAEKVDRDLAEARYQGALLLAESAEEKGVLMYEWAPSQEFHFGFESRLYWFKMDLEKFHKAMQALEESERHKDRLLNDRQRRDKALRQCGAVVEIANCYPEALYYQRNEVTDEAWYYFRVDFPHDGGSVKNTFTGGQVSAASEFKKRLIHMAPGAVFTGSGQQLDRIMKEQLFNIRTVQTIDFVGYSKEYRAYVFGDIAVRDGVVSEVNEEDFFEFGKLRLKTLQKSIALHIQRDAQVYREDWVPMLWTSFGAKGVVALAFWFGSLFAEQIRAQHSSFPFLELTGKPGSGKSTLLMFLWKLLGREYEGFDAQKSTKAGRQRHMGQVSNMPVVFKESDRNEPDRAHAKTFDWDELKEFFNGGTLGTKGVKTAGNETYEPPFRGTIAITQNAEVSASEAILTRICKLWFPELVATVESRAAADNLNLMRVGELSHFMLKALRAEAQVLSTFVQRVAVHEASLRRLKEIRVERIIKNHAQMMAMVDCLRLVCPLTDEMLHTTQQQLMTMALERQSAISADHPLVAEFWEVFEYLETTGEGPQVNHSTDPKLIAINLNQFAEKASEHRQNLADLKTLRDLLRDCRSHKLLDANKSVHSAVRAAQAKKNSMYDKPTTLKCWVFKA
ncbi:toprim domain-containing protein [Azotobacter beijerinckii]|uniref:Toprim-like n=1 Tax=Azotobacter beijerinckii TaxID=170623 RepID=A0A1I1A0L6_9GAMM|nr:toprim domain-containing protein [Azotobacter beijerinckii]SFB30150.1 Toprim-like [Azotobacter beijerinckii]